MPRFPIRDVLTLTIVGCVVLVGASVAPAAEPTREQAEFFEKSVRPLLIEKCYSCHSDAQKKHKGGLVVDSLAGLQQGGDTGPALVPGNPDKSLIVEAVRYTNEDMQMPPKGKLADAEIAILTKWVKLGAPWPNAKATTNRRVPGTITEEDRNWWAFRPMKAGNPPDSGNGWARTDIDRFIAAKLTAAGLTPAPEATKLALIRRLTFDLIGLPPTPQEIDAFLADPSPSAYENLVDRLLASPRYGERAARHWLDLVRYADSDGYRIDDYRPNAWRYRDYVIRAFNTDKPYNRFVQEQLAGDELFPGDPEALIATGYLRHGIYEYNNRDARGQWSVILNDITDTTADVFLGLGLQCARCHDHKFDPILQKDYFRLQAFFGALLPREDLAAATANEKAEHAKKLKAWEEKTAAIRAELDTIEEPYRQRAAKSAITKFPDDVQAMMQKPVAERAPYEHQVAELAYRQVYYEYDRLDRLLKPADKEKVLALRRKLAEFDALKPAPLPVAFAATDLGPNAAPTMIPKKADTPIEPGFLTLLDPKPAQIAAVPNSTGRRSALANWLTQPENPLTARVIVNRVWQQHFGRGLAANASDFGKLGDAPTHPELLDWLAIRFVQDGWSLKKLHQQIVTSAVYRESSTHPNPSMGRLKDPENKLLWKAGVRRLEAEQIRDALFAVTGELTPTEGGPGSAATEPRRSIYAKIMRNTRDPLLDVFDAPYWFNSASSRDTTTTPVQSLLLINSPVMLARSRAFAARLEKDEPNADSARIIRAYRLAFGREPTAEEVAAAEKFLAEQPRRIDANKSGSVSATFAVGKIPYRDGQATDIKLDAAIGLEVPHAATMPTNDFTIEAFVYPRSVADSGAVRTILAKWAGDPKQPGWGFGITGKKSRRKPQTIVMQMFGKKQDGTFGEEAIFSDQHVQLNKPYYLAVSVKFATAKEKGLATFYLKDLSNDDEPLLVAKLPHTVMSGVENTVPLSFGGRSGSRSGNFDGLLDDVRYSNAALGVDQLLFTHEGTNKHTVGYWQMEAKPSMFRDASGHALDIRPATGGVGGSKDVRKMAWADLCHALLNASEFLYVE